MTGAARMEQRHRRPEKGMAGATSVSYTHLDVYKRQVPSPARAGATRRIRVSPAPASSA